MWKKAFNKIRNSTQKMRSKKQLLIPHLPNTRVPPKKKKESDILCQARVAYAYNPSYS
jgi:hypothetical protein